MLRMSSFSTSHYKTESVTDSNQFGQETVDDSLPLMDRKDVIRDYLEEPMLPKGKGCSCVF